MPAYPRGFAAKTSSTTRRTRLSSRTPLIWAARNNSFASRRSILEIFISSQVGSARCADRTPQRSVPTMLRSQLFRGFFVQTFLVVERQHLAADFRCRLGDEPHHFPAQFGFHPRQFGFAGFP